MQLPPNQPQHLEFIQQIYKPSLVSQQIGTGAFGEEKQGLFVNVLGRLSRNSFYPLPLSCPIRMQVICTLGCAGFYFFHLNFHGYIFIFWRTYFKMFLVISW